jgi:hypothetical protein
VFNPPPAARVKAYGESEGPCFGTVDPPPELTETRGNRRREFGEDAAREPRPPGIYRTTTKKETGLMRFGARMIGLRRRLGAFAFTALALLLLTCIG